VRRRNCGIDGKPVLFYAKGHRQQPRKTVTRKRPTNKKKEFNGIVDGLTGLGISGVTDDQVAAAVKTLFPDGINSTDQADVLRAVFLHLKRQDSSDNVGR